jgi:outer membrane lipoprotein SlyB
VFPKDEIRGLQNAATFGAVPHRRYGPSRIFWYHQHKNGIGKTMKTTHAMIATAIAATFLGGCAIPAQQVSSPTYPASSPAYATSYGSVNSIQTIPASPTGGIGVGTVVGGVVGGLLGNQIGGGDGRKLATVAGVVGGAVVGNQVEQRNRAPARDMYQISVRLDNGSYQTIEQDSLGDLRVGNRARIENGRVSRY